jgi:hypothetical protein
MCRKKLNDPKSYESVSFSELTPMKDKIMKSDSGTVDTIHYDGRYEIAHTYRAKNALGAVITESKVFQIDSGLTEARCCFVGQNVVASN